MATLERKPKPSTGTPSVPAAPSAASVSSDAAVSSPAPAVVAAPSAAAKPAASAAPAAPAAGTSIPAGAVFSSPTLPATEENAVTGEKRLVEFLRRPESLETVKGANPKIAQAAIDAAVGYVTNRTDPASWVAVATSQPQSVLNAVTKLAASGLIVSQLTGEAFLVPRFDKTIKSNIVTPVPGVRGLEKRIFESGKIASIDGNVVRAQDHFDANEGLNATLVFKRNLRPDAAKPNPVVGAYVVITSTENRPAKIKTTAIEERVAGEGAMTKKFWSLPGGKDLNMGRMNLDSAAVYAVQRPAMREVIRTWLHDNPELNKLVEMEDASLKTGEEIVGAQPRITGGTPRRNNGPSVTASKVETAPAVDQTNGKTNGTAGHENGTAQANGKAHTNGTAAKPDPVAAAVENARLAVPAAPEENLKTAMRRAGGVRML